MQSDPWIDLEFGDQVRVLPIAEHSLRGREGTVRHFRENGFGMKWAYVQFNDKPKEPQWVRTMHLELDFDGDE